MGTTLMSVKAALVRGRRNLMQLMDETRGAEVLQADTRAVLDRYARLFNSRDWEGVRALIGDDCRLDLVSKSQRRGKQVGMFFSIYEGQNVRLRWGRREGRWALAAFVDGATNPSYFLLLQVEGGQVAEIRDFRYVPYIMTEADFVLTPP